MRSSIPDRRLDTTIWKTKFRLSPKKLQTVSVLSLIAPLSCAEQGNRETSHHVATEKVEELAPFGAAALGSGASSTPSGFSERYFYHYVTWDEKRRTCRRQTDYVFQRRRRSRRRAAFHVHVELEHHCRKDSSCPPLCTKRGPTSGKKSRKRKRPKIQVQILKLDKMS